MEDDSLKLSIIVPVFNEQNNISPFLSRLIPVCNKLEIRYEIIFVNDGSKDNTLHYLILAAYDNNNIKIINLSRNFGKEAASTAGLDHTQAESAILIDADLQDPPELIYHLYQEYVKGYDVVLAIREKRVNDSFIKRNTARLFYFVFQRFSEININPNAGDFRIISRRVIDVVKNMPERTRFMKGILSWPGFKTSTILYEREKRFKDKTKWKLWDLWNFALDGLLSFSTLPLRIWTYIGLTISFFALVYLSITIIKTMIYGVDVPGYASLLSTILLLGGINLIGIGILGEYVGRIFTEVKVRPIYIIESIIDNKNA